MLFDLNTFSTDYLAPAIIILGLFGNLFGLIVISKKKLKKPVQAKKAIKPIESSDCDDFSFSVSSLSEE